ncbi:MAG TPA: hypothetical protein VMP01_20620 [Pirellulaceae bacterium]|nr:hypothetical protein [Pirellulaceae bacterium]
MASLPTNPNSEPRGYPIGALFVLVTVGAVLTVAVTPQIRELGREGANVTAAIGAVIAGGVVGLVLGAILGMLSHRWSTGLVLGAGSGLLVGMVAGLIGTTPTQHVWRMAVAMIAGSVIIVVVAYVMRRRE